jgi:hypothetical protein
LGERPAASGWGKQFELLRLEIEIRENIQDLLKLAPSLA